jgi:UDP-glucose 6-dehydrogenase
MKISIVIPFHWMENWPQMMERCLKSIEAQSFKDYEVVLIKHSTMPVTSNRVIESAKGELVKVLYMDDYLAHGNALQEIVDNFSEKTQWLVTGCLHDEGTTMNHHGMHCYTQVSIQSAPQVC